MKKIALNTLFLLLLTVTMSAQNYTLSGIVKDSKKQPLPYTNVAIINADKSLQNGVATLKDGTFSIKGVNQGTYKLIVSFVGYKDYEKEIKVTSSMQLPVIILEDDAEMLQMVEVIGYKKLISNDKGKMTLNVEGSMLSTMPSSTMLMSFVPGVKVINDNVEVLGKGTPLIFINGREVKNQAQISSLQPAMIKSITVDRNPSAKYDAEYDSVIHIVTKSQSSENLQVQLYHGSNLGRKYSHSNGLYVNHKQGKFTNYISYGFTNSKKDESVNSFLNTSFNEIKQDDNFYSHLKENTKKHKLTFSSNIKLNPKNTIDIQYFYKKEKQKASVTGYEKLTGIDNIKYDVNRYGGGTEQKNTLNLKYSLHLDSLSTFDIYGDYTHKKSYGTENVLNKAINSGNSYFLGSDSKFDVYGVRVEYSKTFANGLNLDLGTRFSEIKSNARSLIEQTHKTTIDNQTELKEQTFASYLTLSKQVGKLSTEVGLRVERNKGIYAKNGIDIFDKPRVTTNVFPSLALNYDASKKVKINFNYTNKIGRPSFDDLDPTVSYLSSFLYEQGNSTLKPTIRHNLSLGTTINDNLIMSIDYNMYRDAILYVAEMSENNRNLFINKAINLDKGSSLAFNTSYSKSFGKFQANISGIVSYSFVEFPFMGKMKRNKKPMFEFTNSNTYIFSPKAVAFVVFQARNKYANTNTVFTPTYQLVVGANFKLLKNKLEMTVFGNNLLNKAYSNSTSEYGYVTSGQNLNLDKRSVGVKLTYNINGFKDIFKSSTSDKEDLERIE